MRKYGCITGLAISLIPIILGTAQAQPLTTSGIGVISCETLARDLKPEQGLNNVTNVMILMWVLGYMSAANMTTLETASNYMDLSKVDERILPLIKEYCEKNPNLKSISLIDDVLANAARIKVDWVKGSIKWVNGRRSR